jgi:hypothetical protein
MKILKNLCWTLVLFIVPMSFAFAQVPTDDDDDEDWDAYGEVDHLGGQARTFANAKITGLSPQRFVTIGYEMQAPYTARFSQIGSFGAKESFDEAYNRAPGEEVRATYTGGLRLSANIPVISRNNIIWQMGANYMQTAYRFNTVSEGGLAQALQTNSLHTTGVFSTLYKPLSATTFLLFQGQADMSGNYNLSNIGNQFLRYSAAAIWGRRPNDNKQWGVGLSRTYRVGAMNYIPVVMFNWTSVNRKWGTEILFPARAHGRYTFNPNSLVLFGYELEGNSYRIQQLSTSENSFEIRRGELKPRLEWQQKMYGYFWLSLQGGVRLDYSYDADYLPQGREFFRGFFGTQDFAQKNSLGAAPYFNVSISFVSP